MCSLSCLDALPFVVSFYIQALTNLKKMDLSWSFNLKELPDFSNTTMLESLVLRGCKNLVEIHSSSQN